MKLSKDDMSKKWSERLTNSDDVIELLEDIADSMDIVSDELPPEASAKIDELTAKVEELTEELATQKQKYIDRFLTGADNHSEEKESSDEVEEEKVIDVKEI